MKITKIEKKKYLYLIELDDNSSFYITEDTIVKFMLSKGISLTQEQVDDIKTFAEFSRGKNRALYYLSFKQRTSQEVKDYLKTHDLSDDSIDSIIQDLTKDNWLNDQRYVESFLEQNLLSGDKGPYLLSQKLKQKGIPPQIIQDSLNHYDYFPILERLAPKLLRKYQQKLPYQALKNKLAQQLTAKGFSFQDSQDILSQLHIEPEEEHEEELLYHDLDKLYRKLSKRYDGHELRQRLTQNLARKGYDFSRINTALKEYF